jgi:hypothetical protein
MKSNWLKAIIISIAMAAVAIWLFKPHHSHQLVMDDWYKEPTSRNDSKGIYVGWKDIATFSIIKPEAEEECRQLLAANSYSELQPEQVGRFAKWPVKNTSGLKPFLVRGLYISYWSPDSPESTGGFQVSQKKGALWVDQAAFGHAYVMQKCPVVVYLKAAPKTMFITTSVAE